MGSFTSSKFTPNADPNARTTAVGTGIDASTPAQ
jgi:hypothetical protein